MHSVQQQLQNLKRLKNVGKVKRFQLLNKAEDPLIHCICECAHNTLRSKVPLSKLQFKKLSLHKKTLRQLTKRGDSLSKKKKIILQSGGFLLPLLTPVIALLVSKLIQNE